MVSGRTKASEWWVASQLFALSTVAVQLQKAPAAAVELNRGGSRDGPASSGSGFWAKTNTLVAGDAALSGILTDLMEAGSGRRQEVASPQLCSLGIERLKDRPVVESLSMMC